VLQALRSRPCSRAPRIGDDPETDTSHFVFVPNVGNAALRRRFTSK
jgi:hypothetical protein